MMPEIDTSLLTGARAGISIDYGTVDDSFEEVVGKRLTQGTSYEDAVTATGYGKFHYILLAMCGIALSSDVIEIVSISFILPPATQELELTSSDKGWLGGVIFLGMMVGGYFWGSLADIYGRRQVIIISLTLNGLGGLTSSLAQRFWLFFFLRFVSGVGVGGSVPVMLTYYMEFQPMSKRGHMISSLFTFWMIGGIIAAGLAWLIIPYNEIGYFSPSFTYNSWRIFLAVCTMPAFSSVLFLLLMPESPRYLLQSGYDYLALIVLRRMYRSNNSGNELTDYPVSCLQISNIDKSNDHPPSFHGSCYSAIAAVPEFMRRTAILFRAPYTRRTIIMSIIYFVLLFGYYGLNMWFPELFNKMERVGGSPCSLGNANHTAHVTSGVNSDIYLHSILTQVSNVPGCIFTIVFIDRIGNGRNILSAASMVISGVCVFFIALVKTKVEALVMACTFSGIFVIAWNALPVITTELYPTHIRSTACGFLMAIGRIAAILANLTFGALIDVHCIVPILLVAVFLTVGGLCALLLPNMTGKDIDQSSP